MIKREKVTIYRENDKSESFHSLLSHNLTFFKDKIYALRVINELSSKVLQNHIQSIKEEMDQRVAKLPTKAKSEYDSLGMEIVASSHQSIETDNLNIEDPIVDKVMLEETKLYNHRKRPEILKSSRRSITYQEAFQYADLNELLKAGSKREARSVIDMDVDKLGKYLSTKFKLNLNQRRDWDQFKEFFYRRHIIVHNYGYPDSIYIANIKWEVYDDEWLEIDNTYLVKAFDIFEKYSNYISGFFDKKYS